MDRWLIKKNELMVIGSNNTENSISLPKPFDETNDEKEILIEQNDIVNIRYQEITNRPQLLLINSNIQNHQNQTSNQIFNIETKTQPSVSLDNIQENQLNESKISELTLRPKKISTWQESWKKEYEWLVEVPSNSKKQIKMCNACNLKIAGGKTHIERHASSDFHKHAINSARKSAKINEVFQREITVINDEAKKLEMSLSLFVAEHNLPFAVFNHLNLLLKNSISDSKIVKKMNIHRAKGQKIIRQVMGPENSRFISEIANNHYYSIIIDESTDITSSRNLAIIIRNFDQKCHDNFLALVPVEDSSALGIYTALLNVLQENNIPLKNLIGFTADNCSVMMGKNNGVQAKLKQLVPKLVVNGCICHNINLISLSAASQLPNSIDQLIREINRHFCNSASRQKDFIKFQEYFGSEVHKILKYASTRWLSRQAAIDRIIEQWDTLLYYFEINNFDTSYGNENIKFIVSHLRNKLIKLYFLFLSYALSIINSINIEMQSEEARVHIIIPRMKYLFDQFTRNFIKKDVLDKTCSSLLNLNENHIPLDQVYCGTQAELLYMQRNLPENELFLFKTNVKNFYINFCDNLRKKINFKDEILNLVPIFTPNHVVSGETNSILPLILKIFPDDDIKIAEQINNKFRALADYPELKKLRNSSISEFWSVVATIKNELNENMFNNISRIAQGILSIPHSSANVERIFSIQNIIKTKLRNRLQLQTCSALLQTRNLIKSDNCYGYKISQDLVKKGLQNAPLIQEELLE